MYDVKCIYFIWISRKYWFW